MNERHERIRLSEKIGYSLGDLGGNMAFQMMMIYQLKFYTDVFGLDGALAGTVLFVAPLLTAFVDPLVGIATDRTHTRWGMYRPWVGSRRLGTHRLPCKRCCNTGWPSLQRRP